MVQAMEFSRCLIRSTVLVAVYQRFKFILQFSHVVLSRSEIYLGHEPRLVIDRHFHFYLHFFFLFIGR